MSSVRPVLRIFDTGKALEFYRDWLGFTVDWEHRFGDNFPLYMQVSLDDIVFHLTEHYGDACPGAKVYIEYCGDLEAWHRHLAAADYRYFKPGIEDASWGGRCMELTDPFGNKLLFCTPPGS